MTGVAQMQIDVDPETNREWPSLYIGGRFIRSFSCVEDAASTVAHVNSAVEDYVRHEIRVENANG